MLKSVAIGDRINSELQVSTNYYHYHYYYYYYHANRISHYLLTAKALINGLCFYSLPVTRRKGVERKKLKIREKRKICNILNLRLSLTIQ